MTFSSPFVIFSLFAGLTVLSACAPATTDALAREAAKAAIRPVLAERLPGVPVEPAVVCVIDNASAQEILSLAAASASSNATSAAATVMDVIRRPATARCLFERGVPILLGQVATGS